MIISEDPIPESGQSPLSATDPFETFGVATDDGPLGAVERTIAKGFRVTVARASPAVRDAVAQPASFHAVLSLTALIEDHTDQVEAVMQRLSRSPTARRLDREMGKTGSSPRGSEIAATRATTCWRRATRARRTWATNSAPTP